jgi:hypothetical protein
MGGRHLVASDRKSILDEETGRAEVLRGIGKAAGAVPSTALSLPHALACERTYMKGRFSRSASHAPQGIPAVAVPAMASGATGCAATLCMNAAITSRRSETCPRSCRLSTYTGLSAPEVRRKNGEVLNATAPVPTSSSAIRPATDWSSEGGVLTRALSVPE